MKLRKISLTMAAIGFFVGAVAVAKPIQKHRSEINDALNGPAKVAVTAECRDLKVKWEAAVSNSMTSIAYMRQTKIDQMKSYAGWKDVRDQLGADSHEMGCPLV